MNYICDQTDPKSFIAFCVATNLLITYPILVVSMSISVDVKEERELMISYQIFNI